MEWRVFFSSFATLFLAELGDKTQLAVFGLSAGSKTPWAVLFGSLAGLSAATVLGAFAGQAVGMVAPERVIKKTAAVLFVAIGLFLWFRG